MAPRSLGRPLAVSLAVHGVAALVIVGVGWRRPAELPEEVAAISTTSTIVAIVEVVEVLEAARPPAPAVDNDVDVVARPAAGGGRSAARAPRFGAAGAHRAATPARPPEPATPVDNDDVEAPPQPEPAAVASPESEATTAEPAAATAEPAATGGDGDGTGSGEGQGDGAGPGRGGAEALGRELHARVLGDEPVDVRAREGVAILSHDQATALRQRDSFPRLPESVWPAWRPYIVRLEVCVAADGHVADAVLRSSASPRLDPIVRAAVKTWRYQPWLVAGTPTAFCHGVVIKYERW